MIVVILVVTDVAFFSVRTILGMLTTPRLGALFPVFAGSAGPRRLRWEPLYSALLPRSCPSNGRGGSGWNGCGVVPVSAMLVCVNLTMPWFWL
jgi:hypothetical protein